MNREQDVRQAFSRAQIEKARGYSVTSYLVTNFSLVYPFRSQNVVNLHTSRNVNKTLTIVNFDPVGGGMAALSY